MTFYLRFLSLVFTASMIFWALPTPAPAFGQSRYAQENQANIEYGKASWYGAENGRHTASGERFDTDALTAAHRHLPFGTIVRVTNRENGRSVEVRINDRGPWRGGRIIDVTSAAADVLGMKRAGIVPVKVEVVRLGSPGHSAFASMQAP